MRVVWALLNMYVPIAFMAFWHKWEWGGTFGRDSELWLWPSLIALSVLVFLTSAIIYLGPNEVLVALFYGYRTYLILGFGFAIALFPGAASTFSSSYMNLARANSTRLYAFLGWAFIVVGALPILYDVF